MAITKITSSVVAANAIIAAGVAENSIGSSEIASNAVGTAQIASGAITTDMLDTNLDIAGTLDVTGVLTADSNVVIAGNLTVNGTTVTNSATNTTIEDALIELGTGTTGTPANDAGIVIERGDSDNAFMGWDESADGFILGTGSFTGASTGNLTISTAPLTIGALTASGIAYPTSDGSSGQYLKTDGAGTLTFANVGAVVNNYTTTGDGSTVAFDTGINPQDEVNTWVFVGGVYQPKNTYSYSGSTITFSEAPANGEDIDITTGTVASFDSADTVLGVYQATTTATDAYDTGLSAANENNTFVFLDGVYQPKTSYTFSGSTITFDANTPADMLLEVMATKTLSASAVTTGTIAANAVTSAKIASNAVLARHIAANAITGAEISSTSQITASTFTGALTGNVTGNVTGNLTGTVQTAAQTNITSVGTLSSLTVSGDLTVDTNTLYVDSADNRVGIGTTDPASTLHVDATGGGVIRVTRLGTSASAYGRLEHDGTNTSLTSSAALIFNSNATHAGRFDTSGRLVVSSSGSAFGADSVTIDQGGFLAIRNTSGATLELRRDTTDGNIVEFQKDGTVVGSIGTAGTDLHIDGTANHSGIRFQQDSLLPRKNGANTNNAIDLGYDDGISVFRFKDLYLSGTANIGGNIQVASGNLIKTKTDSGEIIRFERSADTNRYSSIHAYSTDQGNAYISFKVHDGATATSQADVLHLKGSGNVGINNTDPKCTLHVKGAIGIQTASSTISLSSGQADSGLNLATLHGSTRGAGRLRVIGTENALNNGYAEYFYVFSQSSGGTYYVNLKFIDEAVVNNNYGRPRLYLYNSSTYNANSTGRQNTDQTDSSTNSNILQIGITNVADAIGAFYLVAEPVYYP